MTITELFGLCAAGGYLLGSVPFGLVLCYLAGYGDIRKIGSGNIGATNVLRTGNKTLALATLLLDVFKAGLAAYAARRWCPDTAYSLWGMPTTTAVLGGLIAGGAAVIGHNFPLWLKFKGGKGVASSFGLVLVLTPKIALAALLIWLITAFAFRYSSLAAIVAAVLTPVLTWYWSDAVHTVVYTAIVALILVRHHANFARLFKGQESKISFKKK